MARRFRAWLAARRFNRLLRDYDRAIAAARRAHKPVRYLQQRKVDAVHAALERAVAR